MSSLAAFLVSCSRYSTAQTKVFASRLSPPAATIASVDTKVAPRDEHLRTSDFFLVAEHPTMTFRSSSISGDPETGEFALEGELTLRGVTKPVTLTGEFGGVVVDGYGNTKAGVSASTVINRHDFGVSWNAALEAGGMTLGDDVAISIELQLVLEK